MTKNFKVFVVHWNIWFSGGRVHWVKNQYKGEEWPKKGASTEGGLGKEEGGDLFEEGCW